MNGFRIFSSKIASSLALSLLIFGGAASVIAASDSGPETFANMNYEAGSFPYNFCQVGNIT